ncbi:PD-(D/E)XK nuclease family protein [Mycoplasma zalophidermidis]|nr:PD-(D/E)XK nuclease family protein [Mycoplasma zalophidermidis]
MYVGDFLHEDGNIGHEIINLCKADDGNNYIYLGSRGYLNKNRTKYESTILLVRPAGKHLYKVLAKALGLHILSGVIKEHYSDEVERYKVQKELNIKYGEVSLSDIFSDNKYKNFAEGNPGTYATYKADEVYLPNQDIFITDKEELKKDNIYYIRTDKGFSKQSLRQYFEKEIKLESYKDLNGLISNKELWHSENKTLKISDLNEEIKKNNDKNSFLKIIKKENDELVFSNLISHFLNINQDLFKSFVEKVLEIRSEGNFVLWREFKNIDILIKDKMNLIIIENKIKSDINSKDKKSEVATSQLSKYYENTQSDNRFDGLNKHYYIFVPNYNPIDKSKLKFGDKYKIVYYDKILKFFEDNLNVYSKYDYFNEFKLGLEKHAREYDNELEEKMKILFVNKIDNLKK